MAKQRIKNENVLVDKKRVEYFAGEAVKLQIRKKKIPAIVTEDVQVKAWTVRFKTHVKVAYFCERGCYNECFVPSALIVKEDYNLPDYEEENPNR